MSEVYPRLETYDDVPKNESIKQWVNTTSRLGYTTSLSFAKTTNRSNSVLDYQALSRKPQSTSVACG